MKKETAQLMERPPIVVIMGHVDHGKSTLLDYIRKANTVAGEAGGITQHVAAYEVEKEHEGKNKRITFIDTPGHAAFSAIRARGATAADIAVLVVAADDGVKPQTLEALQSIRDSGIPFVVAINKIDKQNASIERTQASLLEHGVYLEKFGGDVPWTAISAKQGTGVAELLDVILLVAEMLNLNADTSKEARGNVIEAHRDQKRGIAATLIITEGTLKSGMAVLAGHAISPVRIMEDHLGKSLKEASFSTPVQLIGFDELPDVGAEFVSFKNKKEAEAARPPAQTPHSTMTVSESSEQFLLPVIVRADTQGSIEAIAQELIKLGDDRKRVNIVQSGIGTISEGDVKVAIAGSNTALIVGFNVGIDTIAEDNARQHGVRVEKFNIIYKLTEKLQEVLESDAPKREVEEVRGKAKVLKLFSNRKDEYVLGGRVDEGYIPKDGKVHVLRRGEIVGNGKILNIQTNRMDASRVDEGNQFGAQVESGAEIVQGDTLVYFTTSMQS